jgi:hypothetical protein
MAEMLTTEEYIAEIFKGAPEVGYDIVNKPKHYILMDNLEVRDVLAALVCKLKKSELIPNNALFESDYVQALQYGMRFMDKGGKQDLEKMRWYLDKLITAYD